ncbi:MAG: MFS transporter [Steroidobacteraceae bacterium]|nr:MFS transporter [Steroidobacteraceae bacterium]
MSVALSLWWGRTGLCMFVLCSGVALHAINLYLATTVMPSIVREIGGIDFYAWNTSLFVVGSILGAALASQLLRRAGCRTAYLLAAIAFAVGCVICASASFMPMFIAGRFVQGLGGGLLLSLPYALLRLLFGPAMWPRAMALLSSMWGVATLLGPALGGVLAEVGVWRAAFASLAFAALLCAAGAWTLLPAQADDRSRAGGVPLAQLALLGGAVLLISMASVMENIPGQVGWLGAAALLLLWLCRREGTATSRLLPRESLGKTPLRALYVSMVLLAVTVTCSESFVPWFLQELHGLGPLAAGFMGATMSAGWTTGSIIASGARSARADALVRTSPWLSSIGLLVLLLLLPPGSGGDWLHLAAIAAALIVIGFAVGIAWPHLATRVLERAAREEGDLAAASIMTIQLVGTALSTALAGIIVNAAGMSEAGGSGSAAFWLFAVVLLAPVWLLLTGAAQRFTLRRPLKTLPHSKPCDGADIARARSSLPAERLMQRNLERISCPFAGKRRAPDD